jgi:hypothetical protein
MRNAVAIIVFVVTIFATAAAVAEDAPATEAAEHLDLKGVAELFSESASVEDFEKQLNTKDNEVNNLDLNSDDEVDYITVVEEVDGDTRVLILRVPLAENEYQDVATVELEKSGDDGVAVQFVGDEELYGPDYIVEPSSSSAQRWLELPADAVRYAATYNYGPAGTLSISPITTLMTGGVVVIRISAWPVLTVVFRPGYRPWRSPYRWRVFPPWWRPWRPVTITAYRARTARWAHRGWTRTKVRHSHRARNVYRTQRRSSPASIHKAQMAPAPAPAKKAAPPPKKAPAAKKKPPATTKKKPPKRRPTPRR